MPTKEELRLEITSGPLATELSPLLSAARDSEVAGRLNFKNIDGYKRVPLADVKRHAMENGYWLAIRSAAASHANQQVQGAAIAALDYVNDLRFDSIDLMLPATQAMLGALVAGSVMTQQQADGLVAMADTKISRSEQLWGFGIVVTPDQIGAAR